MIRKHTLEATGGQTYAEMPRAVFKKAGDPVPDDEADQLLLREGDRQPGAGDLGSLR